MTTGFASGQADQPITTATQDKLGRAEFAHHVAKHIAAYSDPTSVVFALYGRWGSGKSSLLNLIAEQLEKQNADTERKSVIVRFNPWNYATVDQLITTFFRDIRLALGTKDARGAGQRLGELLQTLSNALSASAKIPTLEPLGWLSKIASVLGFVLAKASKEQTLDHLKKEIEKEMKKLKRRIVVMIDDIDRLEADNIALLFRLIRLNADLPNTVYVLAFDRNVVEGALSKKVMHNASGRDYLDKIVQIGIDIPLVTPEQLQSLVSKALKDAMPTVTQGGEWDQHRDRWQDLYFGGIRHLLHTPRDILRYINGLRLTYPLVQQEVNPVDFIALEAIRTFRPDLYAFIAENREFLLPHGMQTTPAPLPKPLESILGSEELNTVQPLRRILVTLFPAMSRYPSISGSSLASGASEDEWRLERRVCSPLYFYRYFTLRIPEGTMSETELAAILNSAAKLEILRDNIKKNLSPTRINRVLEYMSDHIAKLSPDEAMNMLRVVFELGDSLAHDAPVFGIGTGELAMFLSRRLFERIDDAEKRDRLLAEIARGAPSLSAVIFFVALLHDDQRQPMFSQAAIKEARALLVERIHRTAKERKLLTLPDPLNIIFRWRDWASKDAVAEYLSDVIKTDDGLLQVLVAFLHEYTSSDGTTTQVTRFVEKNYLAEFLDVEALATRVQALKDLPPRELTSEEALAVQTFLAPPRDPGFI